MEINVKAYVNTANPKRPVEFRDVEAPRPRSNEALVSVRGFSLNRGELSLMAVRPDGWRPGQDIAGVIEGSALDGSGPAPGMRVFGIVEHAGWSEKVAIPTDRLALLPESLSFEVGAALPMAGLTALRLTRLVGPLIGKQVLVTGASGGVGHLLAQLAGLAGAKVQGARSAAEADDTLFDAIFESVGGASLDGAIARIAPHGTIALFGNTSGKRSSLDIFAFMGHEGAAVRTFFSYDPPGRSDTSADLSILADLVAAGSLRVDIGSTADWGEIDGAINGLRDRKFKGKAVLTLPAT